jgi:hypothetical protein
MVRDRPPRRRRLAAVIHAEFRPVTPRLAQAAVAHALHNLPRRSRRLKGRTMMSWVALASGVVIFAYFKVRRRRKTQENGHAA